VESLSAVLHAPNSSIVQIEMTKFTGLGGWKNFSGSGILIAPNWVLTAGHNIYGSGGIGYATKVVVHPGQTAQTNNGDQDYRPFGEAVAVGLHVPWQYYTGNDNYDIGLIELDRNIGSTKFAGRMDYGWLSANFFDQSRNSPLRMLGYPADGDFQDNNYQISSRTTSQGLWAVNTSLFGDRRVAGDQVIKLPADEIAGESGASGGPVYVDPMDIGHPEWGIARAVIGVYVRGPAHPESYNVAEATRITPELFGWINGYVKPVIVNNRYTFPDKKGIDKPDLMAYDPWFHMHRNSTYSVQRGTVNGRPVSKLNVKLDVWNGGTAASGAVKVQFYLTQDPIKLTGLIPVGQPTSLAGMGPLNRSSPVTASALVTLPSNLRRGSWYVAWRIDSDHKLKEFTDNFTGTDNNLGYFQWKTPLLFDGSTWRVIPGGSQAPAVAPPAVGGAANANSMAGLFLGTVSATASNAVVEKQAALPVTERSAARIADWISGGANRLNQAPSLDAVPAASSPRAMAARDEVFVDFGIWSASLPLGI
jgi:V8-like Glu-specific endopeptidase